jgi:hypothetical protein
VEKIHHRAIKKFNIDGIIHDDKLLVRLKNEYVRLLTTQMKLKGYVPRYDIDMDFTLDYNENKQYFEFELTLYGVYVGKRKAEWIQGIDGQKVIYTPTNKLNESSTVQA